jgi:hypothetical protein
MIGILAGNWPEANNFLIEHCEPKKIFKIIYDANDIESTYFDGVIRIGSWKQRQNLNEIELALGVFGIKNLPQNQIEFKPVPKPPIGIEPQSVWISRRMRELLTAMNSYAENEKPIPIKWIGEYNRHLQTLVKLNKP